MKVATEQPGQANGVILSYSIKVEELDKSYNFTHPKELIIGGKCLVKFHWIEYLDCKGSLLVVSYLTLD